MASTTSRLKNFFFWSGILLTGALVLFFTWSFISRMFIAPRVDSEIERRDLLVKPGERIQLNVMNGSGASGVGLKVTNYLRARGFDIVEMSSFSSQQILETSIYDHIGDSVSARKVAYALGVVPGHIIRKIDSTAFLDVTVIIGKDYSSQLKPFK